MKLIIRDSGYIVLILLLAIAFIYQSLVQIPGLNDKIDELVITIVNDNEEDTDPISTDDPDGSKGTIYVADDYIGHQIGNDYIDIDNYYFKNALNYGKLDIDALRIPPPKYRKLIFGRLTIEHLAIDIDGIPFGTTFNLKNKENEKFICGDGLLKAGGITESDPEDNLYSLTSIVCSWYMEDDSWYGTVVIDYSSTSYDQAKQEIAALVRNIRLIYRTN